MISEFINLNPEKFEELVRDIFNFKEETTSYQKYGIPGQRQDGIDIYSSETQVAIQCKFLQKVEGKNAKKNLLRIIRSEIEKIKKSKLVIKNFFIVSTFSHDRSIIDECNALQYMQGLQFSISYIGWNELRKWVIKSENIICNYFPNTFSINQKGIELSWIGVDSDFCAWGPSKSDYNSFDFLENGKSTTPLFDFRFINHSENTIILNRIDLHTEILPMALSGFYEESNSGFLKSIGDINFELKRYEPINSLYLKDPIFAKAKVAFRFKVLLFYKDPEICFDTGRLILNFKFYFNSEKVISSDLIYLNCSEATKQLKIITIE